MILRLGSYLQDRYEIIELIVWRKCTAHFVTK